MAEVIRGYLIINVVEASGKTQRDQFTWDTNSGAFDAFVKVEVRGGPRNVKAQTSKAQLLGDTITWRQELRLELIEGSNELRLMLCREKFQGNKKGTSVIAACGIFVNDILEAVPIDKYFELFKPNAGGEGGFVRISMNFVRDLAELDSQRQEARGTFQPALAFGQTSGNPKDIEGKLRGIASPGMEGDVAKRVANIGKDSEGAPKKRRGGARKVLVPLTIVAGVAGAVVGVLFKLRK